METRNNISCKKIQELLLEKKGKLDKAIVRHLEACEKCREFQKILAAISRSAQITSEDLQPGPQIINTLKRNFKEQTASDNLLEQLLALLQKRIPAYQILLAVFIAAISYFSITKINSSQPDLEQVSLISRSENQIIQFAEFPVVPLEQDQQIGKSLSEDSLSAKFRVSIL